MLAAIHQRRRRRGVTVVESALALGVLLMLLFGIFEYCRYLLVLHVTNNAARDGARYASVNGDKPSSFNTTDYTDASGALYPSVLHYTQTRLSGVQKQINGLEMAVYPVDPVGLAQSPSVVRSATLSTATPKAYPDPFVPDSNTPPWNQAAFPNRIAVTIRGEYRPITPLMLFMPSSVRIEVTSIAGVE